MTDIYKNNPLHSLKLQAMLTELVDFYGWEILAAALNLNCFKTNPNMKGCVKFLRKTTWAREKVEGFYLYRFKNLPRPDDKQFALPPRDRIIPEDQKPRQPVALTLESLEQARLRKEENLKNKPASKSRHSKDRSRNTDSPWKKSAKSQSTDDSPWGKSAKSEEQDEKFDPWAEARKRLTRDE